MLGARMEPRHAKSTGIATGMNTGTMRVAKGGAIEIYRLWSVR